MKPIFTVLLMMSMLALSPACRADELDDQYLAILSTIQQADTLGDKGQWTQALVKYTEAQAALKQFQHDNPLWSAKLVKFRTTYVAGKVSEATSKAASGEAVEAMEMKLKWLAGKSYLQHIDVAQSADVTVPGTTQTAKQEMKMAYDVSISPLKEREGGVRVLQLEIIGVKMETRMGGRTFLGFDSNQDLQKDAGSPVAPLFRKFIGARLVCVLNANDKVEKVEGFDDLMTRVSEGKSEELQAQAKGLISENNVKEICSQAEGLPNKPVKVGDTWLVTTEEEMAPLGTMVQSSKFTFKSWEQHNNHKCALFEFTGTISPKTGGDSQPVPMTVEDGHISGKTWFDPALGMVVDTTANEGMSIKVQVQGQSLTTKVSQVVESKLVKVEDISK